MAIQRKKTTKLSSQAVMGEIKTLAMLTGGVVIGSVGGKLIDKVLKVDAAATGFNAKALARPIVLLGVGAAGNLMLKDPNLKMLATGVGAAGMLSGVKVFLKKDLLSGLSDFSMSGIDGLGEPTVYREPMNLSIERYNPDLPVLSSPTSLNSQEFDASVEGLLEEDFSYIEII
jgi:hypothetical protein